MNCLPGVDCIYKVSYNTKVNIGVDEFRLLSERGFVNSKGEISKYQLKDAENYLQECGWNGIFFELHDINKFDKLSDIVEFVIE